MTAKHVLLHCAKAYSKRHPASHQPAEILAPHNPLEQQVQRIETIILKKMTTSSDPALPLLLKKIARIKQQLHVSSH